MIEIGSYANLRFLIIIAVIFAMSGILFVSAYIIGKKNKTKSRYEEKNAEAVFKVLRTIFMLFVPKQSKFKYRMLYLRLREAGFNSVEKLYLFKILVPLILILPTLMATKYYIDSSNINMIRRVEITKMELLVSDNQGKNLEQGEYFSEKQNENERYFNIIKDGFRLQDLKRVDLTKQIANLLSKKTSLSSYDAKLMAESMQRKFKKLIDERYSYLIVLLIIVLGYQFPNLILFLIHKLRSLRRESEKILITELIICLGNIQGIQVYEIIKKLAEVTRIYRYLFKKCLDDFESGSTTVAMMKLKESTNDLDIIELADFLIIVQENMDINSKIYDYEIRQFEKKQSLEAMEKVKQDRVMAVTSLLIGTSIFVVLLSIIIGMNSLFKMLQI